MRWDSKKQRCTISELALYFRVDRNKMSKIIKRQKVDLTDIGSIITFCTDQAVIETVNQTTIKSQQTN